MLQLATLSLLYLASTSRNSAFPLLLAKSSSNIIMPGEEEAATTPFVNASDTGEIPSFNGDEKAKATDFANYFCSYAQLYHQKQMLTGACSPMNLFDILTNNG